MPRIPPALHQALKYAALTGVVLATAAVIFALGPGAGWVLRHVDGVRGLKGKELEDALDAVRGRALAVATGLAALVAVYYTARNAETARRMLEHSVESAHRSAELTEQGQVTDRYTKAIEQLGSDKIDIRIGGIYALERIAADSVRDHPTVMEVLATFVRERTKARRPSSGSAEESDPWEDHRPPLGADVQAALIAIGRRSADRDARPINLAGADLAHADLAGADLAGAELVHTDLFGAELADASLIGADLAFANLTSARMLGADLRHTALSGADLRRADLPHANLAHANLHRTNLSNANLTGADLRHANLKKADLTGADLEGADLRETDLTLTRVASVAHSAETLWPGGFVPYGGKPMPAPPE